MLLVYKATSNQQKLDAVKQIWRLPVRDPTLQRPARHPPRPMRLRHNFDYPLAVSDAVDAGAVGPVIAQLQFQYGQRAPAGRDFVSAAPGRRRERGRGRSGPEPCATSSARGAARSRRLRIHAERLAWRLRARAWRYTRPRLRPGAFEDRAGVAGCPPADRRSGRAGFLNERSHPAEDPLPGSVASTPWPMSVGLAFGWGPELAGALLHSVCRLAFSPCAGRSACDAIIRTFSEVTAWSPVTRASPSAVIVLMLAVATSPLATTAAGPTSPARRPVRWQARRGLERQAAWPTSAPSGARRRGLSPRPAAAPSRRAPPPSPPGSRPRADGKRARGEWPAATAASCGTMTDF